MPKVNQDYLCIITVKNSKTAFEKVNIPQSEELVRALENLANNPNRTVLDLQSTMNNSFPPSERGRINYVSPIPYNSSYIDIASYPLSRTNEEYISELDNIAIEAKQSFKRNNEDLLVNPSQYNEKMREYVENKVNNYKESIKSSFYFTAKRYIMAFNYRKTLNAIKSKPEVRMYSTDTLGWSTFKYQVTDDVVITVATNFGYGSSSYFHLGLQYKGIDILPYSLVVDYYYARMEDISRYTRMYKVDNDSWDLAFKYVEQTANLASEDPKAFVSKEIVNEVHKMIEGLKFVLEPTDRFMESYINAVGTSGRDDYLTVRNMAGHELESYRVYPEEMGMATKAEKITGSLAFLDNLRRLSESVPDIEYAITVIVKLASELLPHIIQMIERLTHEIANLEERLSKEKLEQEKIQTQLKPYENEINQLFESRKKDYDFLTRSEVEKDYRDNNQTYDMLKERDSESSSLIHKLSVEKTMRNSFRNQLNQCIDRAKKAGIGEDV